MSVASSVKSGFQQAGANDGRASDSVRPMEEVIGQMMGMGVDPNSKKNSTTVDYVATLRHDTYDFIRPKQFDLSGRAVFVTGASRGFGKAIAISYAKAGASKIGIGARSNLDHVVAEVEAAAKAAGRAAPEIVAVNMDVTKASSVGSAVVEIEKAFGGLDVLVNNAGYLEHPVKLTEADAADWWRVFEVNVLGTFLVTQNFLPLLLKQSSGLKTVANVSSMWGLTYWPGGSAYQISKLALIRFAQVIESEYGDQGVISFSIHPGSTATELSSPMPPEILQFMVDNPAMGGDTMVWLTAERREWLSGRFVNGAWDMEEFLAKKERTVAEDHLKMRLAVGLE